MLEEEVQWKCHLKSRPSSRGDHPWWFELLHQLVHVSRMRTRHNNPWMKTLSKSGSKGADHFTISSPYVRIFPAVSCLFDVCRRYVQWSVAEKWFLLSGLLLLYDMRLPAAPFRRSSLFNQTTCLGPSSCHCLWHQLTFQSSWLFNQTTFPTHSSCITLCHCSLHPPNF